MQWFLLMLDAPVVDAAGHISSCVRYPSARQAHLTQQGYQIPRHPFDTSFTALDAASLSKSSTCMIITAMCWSEVRFLKDIQLDICAARLYPAHSINADQGWLSGAVTGALHCCPRQCLRLPHHTRPFAIAEPQNLGHHLPR